MKIDNTGYPVLSIYSQIYITNMLYSPKQTYVLFNKSETYKCSGDK